MNLIFEDLQSLHDAAVKCTRCNLAKTRTQVVFGEGPKLAAGEIGIMLFGEAPGEDEDKQGRPFVGRSGKLMDAMLKEAGLERSKIWVTNTAKCRPVLLEGTRYKNRAPSVDEQNACENWWHNEVRLLKPEIILCLGATAAKKLLDNQKFQITRDRGEWWPGPQNTELLVTFHPSYVLRMEGEAFQQTKRTVVEDLRAVKTRLEALRAGTAQPQSWQKPKPADDNGQLSMF